MRVKSSSESYKYYYFESKFFVCISERMDQKNVNNPDSDSNRCKNSDSDLQENQRNQDEELSFWKSTYTSLLQRYKMLEEINLQDQTGWNQTLMRIKQKLQNFAKSSNGWLPAFETLNTDIQVCEVISLCVKECEFKITHVRKNVSMRKKLPSTSNIKKKSSKSFTRIDLIVDQGRIWFKFRCTGHKKEKRVFEDWEITLSHLQEAAQNHASPDGVIPHVFLIYVHGTDWKFQPSSNVPGITVWYGLHALLRSKEWKNTCVNHHQGVFSLSNETFKQVSFENLAIQLDLSTCFMLVSHTFHSDRDHPGRDCELKSPLHTRLFSTQERILLSTLINNLEQLRDHKKATFYMTSLTRKRFTEVVQGTKENSRTQEWLSCIQIIDEKKHKHSLSQCEFPFQSHPVLSQSALAFVSLLLNKTYTKSMFESAHHVDLTLTSNRKIAEKLKSIGYFTHCRFMLHPTCPLSERDCIHVS